MFFCLACEIVDLQPQKWVELGEFTKIFQICSYENYEKRRKVYPAVFSASLFFLIPTNVQ